MTQTVTRAASWRLALLAFGVVLLLAGCGPAQNVGGAKARTSTVPTQTAAAVSTPEPTAEETTEDAAPPAGPRDFALSVKVLTQECFGSAGCNLTYRVQVDHGPTSGSYEVTYEVAVPGDENSPHTGTLTVDDGKYDEPFEDMASPSHRIKSASKIKVKVTAVEAR